MSCVTSTHISLAKATHMVRRNFKGIGECNLTLCPDKGNWDTDQLYALHTSEGVESDETRYESVLKNCKRNTTVSPLISACHTTESIQDFCHTEIL